MERTEHVDTPVATPVLFAVVEDLARYADWLDIVVAAIPTEARPGDEGPAWSVELRGRIGPLARSKRLRMVRVRHDVPEQVVFERREPGERSRSPWTLTAQVEPTDPGSRLTMSLHYGGALWGSMLERLLADEVERARPRLLALLADDAS
ncbi:MAG: SRPBCC family protein [Acidimicrobiales bacterium]